MKFLQTIRFDASDDHVYERAAGSAEWAVSGAFAFAGLAPEEVKGKTKQAFANGFLGLDTFGRSTFAAVAELDAVGLEQAELRLARHFVERYGAPDIAQAMVAAREETAFVADLCAQTLVNTVFTVRRLFDAEGQIKEEFRTIKAPGGQPPHTRIWNVVEGDG
jgi:hypothetical protein